MRVLLILSVSFIVAAHGYITKRSPDAYCNTTLTAVQSNALELEAYDKFFTKTNDSNVAAFQQEYQTISSYVIVLDEQLMDCITKLEDKQSEIDAQLDPYLTDPLTPNAQLAKDKLAAYVMKALDELNSLKTAIDGEYATYYDNIKAMVSDILKTIAQRASDALSYTQPKVTSPETQVCACKNFRDFVRFSMDTQSAFVGCISDSFEVFTDTKDALSTMIAATCRTINAPPRLLNKCFENVAVEETDATKKLLNACLGAMQSNLGEFTNDLPDLLPPIKDYQAENFDWDFDLASTCVSISMNELGVETNRYFSSFDACTSGGSGGSTNSFKIYDDFSDVKILLEQYKSRAIVSNLIAQLNSL